MIQIYDNIITEKLQNKIFDLAFAQSVVWNYDLATIHPDLKISPKNTLESFQFRSIVKHDEFINNHEIYNGILDLFKEIQKKTGILLADPYRVKLNLLPNDPRADKKFHHTPHIDADQDHYVLIYYIDDSDGDTVIFKETKKDFSMQDAQFVKEFTIEERIEPKKGRFVLFDGDKYHTGSSPQNNLKRTVININFDKKNVLL